MRDWPADLLSHSDMLLMGHGQTAPDANLGLGWIYYGLVRAIRPANVVVIGSWRGFVPIILGQGLIDNNNGGTVTFIEPSLVDDFWAQPEKVARHFEQFEVDNIRHFRMTTQDFTATSAYSDLDGIGVLFVDGMHTYEQAKFDFEAFADKLSADAVVLFHDSIRVRLSRIYVEDRAYLHRVKDFMDSLRQRGEFQLFDLPIDGGVTLLRRQPA